MREKYRIELSQYCQKKLNNKKKRVESIRKFIRDGNLS